jgi:hypothetical protein
VTIGIGKRNPNYKLAKEHEYVKKVNRKSETWRPKTPNPKPETRKPKPENRNPKPEPWTLNSTQIAAVKKPAQKIMETKAIRKGYDLNLKPQALNLNQKP